MRRGAVHTFVGITGITGGARARILPASLDEVVGILYVTTEDEIGWYMVREYTWPNVWPDNLRLTFRHHASCILGQAFHYSPENAFYIFNQQIYFII